MQNIHKLRHTYKLKYISTYIDTPYIHTVEMYQSIQLLTIPIERKLIFMHMHVSNYSCDTQVMLCVLLKEPSKT